MYKDHSVYVVIPSYNVAAHIAQVIADIPDYVDGVVAVDDCSGDHTPEVLRTVADPRLVVVSHTQNRGVGGAMVTGFEKAAGLGADILVKVDGDGQMDPRYLPALLDAIVDEGYAYGKGNRLLDGQALGCMPRTRFIGNLVLTFLTKAASGYWHLMDPQNGFVAVRASVWAMLDHSRIATGYFFENDMLVNLNILNARAKDVPMPARYQGETSSMCLRRVIPIFTWLLLQRIMHRFYTKYMLRDFSPIALFVLSGLPMLLWGVGFGACAWWTSAQEGTFASTGTVMLSVLPLLLGFQLMLQALVLDIHETPR